MIMSTVFDDVAADMVAMSFALVTVCPDKATVDADRVCRFSVIALISFCVAADNVSIPFAFAMVFALTVSISSVIALILPVMALI